MSLSQQRQLAISIDDLPAVRCQTLEMRRRVTDCLVSTLQLHQIPAIGFVNEQKLGEPVPNPDNVALLETWLDAGLELGNHTYSHASLFSMPLEEFKLEVLLGGRVTGRLLETRGRRLRFFRHPFLNTGPDHDIKRSFEEFLEREGYTVAPVTVDNSEWIYADAYDAAKTRSDTALASAIGADYIRYMREMFEFYETLSRDLFEREISQVLLIHANQLNADYLGSLLSMVEQREYKCISLEAALRDPAYRSSDDYVGENGISWLQRWWITNGKSFRHEPEVPEWIEEVRTDKRV
jgi:peptidoglycan/xylan/chitin deacetylase (PgdA/CDA1 family)